MKTLSLLVLGSLLFFATTSANAQDAADVYYGSDEMKAARAALRKGVGGQSYLFLMADRLEYQSGDAESAIWDVQGWYGTDRHKVWIKSEGEYALDTNETEESEVQLLYSRAISPFFDLQAGVRQDFGPGDQPTWGVVGIQGLAPYWFEVDASLYVSDEGDFTAQIEAEYEFLLTQRLILQPRAELNVALQEIEALGVGAGFNNVELGLRLRYEIKREIAPYIGISWKRSLADTADIAFSNGDDIENVSFVAGIRLWF
jgi:copper resistance protein B